MNISDVKELVTKTFSGLGDQPPDQDDRTYMAAVILFSALLCGCGAIEIVVFTGYHADFVNECCLRARRNNIFIKDGYIAIDWEESDLCFIMDAMAIEGTIRRRRNRENGEYEYSLKRNKASKVRVKNVSEERLDAVIKWFESKGVRIGQRHEHQWLKPKVIDGQSVTSECEQLAKTKKLEKRGDQYRYKKRLEEL